MASRWPQRFPPAALISFSISRSVRYSRGLTGRSTVTFTAIGAHIPGAVFSIVSRNIGLKLLRFFQKCNSIDIGLQTVTEGKERTSTWVKSQVGTSPGQCPLYPQKRTFAAHKPMSALCQ